MATKAHPLEKVLILIRHAHRDKKGGRDSDNGLSSMGKKQAQNILKHFERNFAKQTPILLCSPKKRCMETVEPIARKLDCPMQISFILDEGGNIEQKVKSFEKWWHEEGPELTVACSHGDWLPVCLKKLTGVRSDMAKGGWAEIRFNNGKPVLISLLESV